MAINGVSSVSKFSTTDPSSGVNPTDPTDGGGTEDITKNPKFMKALNNLAANTLQGGQGMLQESMSKLYAEDEDEEPLVDDEDDAGVV